MKLKICGMREPFNIQEVALLQPDYMGFIFYPESPRYIGDFPVNILADIPGPIKKTGVFVNEDLEQVKNQVVKYGLEAIQLHGKENPAYCGSLRNQNAEIIKAFGIDENFDFELLVPYLDQVDYFLFDTQTSQHGGSGRKFNWRLLDKYRFDKPYFLSGGIELSDIHEIRKIKDNRLYALDINSKFEIEPGLKDVNKLRDFKNSLSGL